MLMNGKKLFCVLLVMLLCGANSLAVAESVENGLTWVFRLDGNTLDESLLPLTAPQETVTVVCGGALVTLEGVVYDGMCLFTSSVIAPEDASRYLVMPATADPYELVRGGHGEGLREDDRTFAQAAKEDGKQILCVDAYPLECDDLGCYWMDYRQDAGVTSTIIAYGAFGWMEEEVTITLQVRVNTIDPTTMAEGEAECEMVSVPVHWLGDIETRTYRAGQANDLRYETLTLVKTPLTTYVYVDGSHEKSVGAAIRNEQGEAYPAGMSMDGYVTLAMEALPETVLVEDVAFVADK